MAKGMSDRATIFAMGFFILLTIAGFTGLNSQGDIAPLFGGLAGSQEQAFFIQSAAKALDGSVRVTVINSGTEPFSAEVYLVCNGIAEKGPDTFFIQEDSGPALDVRVPGCTDPSSVMVKDTRTGAVEQYEL